MDNPQPVQMMVVVHQGVVVIKQCRRMVVVWVAALLWPILAHAACNQSFSQALTLDELDDLFSALSTDQQAACFEANMSAAQTLMAGMDLELDTDVPTGLGSFSCTYTTATGASSTINIAPTSWASFYSAFTGLTSAEQQACYSAFNAFRDDAISTLDSCWTSFSDLSSYDDIASTYNGLSASQQGKCADDYNNAMASLTQNEASVALDMSYVFSPAASDLSIAFLSSMFGNVGNVLVGASSQLMGQLLGLFNLAIVTIAGGFVLHNVVRSAFGSSQALEGSQGTGWSVIRVISGVALMMPQFTGYSMMQVLVMWVAVKGVAVADTLWDVALDYANSMGGGIYQVTTPSDYEYVSAYVGVNHSVSSTTTTLSKSYMNDYFASAACLEALRENDDSLAATAGLLGMTDTTSVGQNYGLRWGADCQISCSDAQVDVSDSAVCQDGMYAINAFCYGSNEAPTVCGGYGWGQNNSNVTDTVSTSLRSALKSVTNFTISLGSGLFVDAYSAIKDGQSAYTTLTASCLDGSDAKSCEWGENLVMAASMYYATIKPILVVDDVTLDDWASDDNWYYSASQHGWIVAGMYYFNLVGSDTATRQSLLPAQTYPVYQLVARSSLSTLSDSQMITAYQNLLSAMSVFTDSAKVVIRNYLSSSMLSTQTINETVSDSDLEVSSTNFSSLSNTINALLVRSITNLAMGETYYEELQLNAFNWVVQSTTDMPDPDDGMPNLYLVQINIHSMLGSIIARFLGLNILKSSSDEIYCNTDFCDDGWFSSDDYPPLRDSCQSVVDACTMDNLTNGACWDAFVSNEGDCLSIGQGVAGQLYGLSQGYRSDPIRNLVNLGLHMIETSVGYWVETTVGLMVLNDSLMWRYFGWSVAVSALSSVIDALSSSGSSGSPGDIIGAVSTSVASMTVSILGMFYQWDVMRMVFFAPIGSAIAALIFSVGVVLAYYVPMVPMTLFIFTVIGWFILLIEAMIAAPLLMLGMTHPAGHDLLGRSEQGLILLLGLFLRPSAIVLGLIVAAVVSYNIVTWVNYGFAMVMNQYLAFVTGMSLIDSAGIKLIGTVAIYIIYAYVMVEVVHYTFSLVYQVPDRLTRWIGGQPEYSSAQQMAGEVQSGLQGAGQGMGQGAGQASGSGATHRGNVSPKQQRASKKDSGDGKSKAESEDK